MGFLHKLWDETLAGPAPDSGLGKLRKYNSFSARRSPLSPAPVTTSVDDIPVSRSITVLRANSGSVPSSPTASTSPTSPFSPSVPRGEYKKLTRRKSTSEALKRADHNRPTGYDWIVISALDR